MPPAPNSNIADTVKSDPQSALVVLHVQLAQDRPPEPVLVAQELGEFLRRVADDELGIPRQPFLDARVLQRLCRRVVQPLHLGGRGTRGGEQTKPAQRLRQTCEEGRPETEETN